MKNNLRRFFAWGAVSILLATMMILPARVVAAGSIDVGRSDIYTKLYEAMQVNVVANTMRKCLASIKASGGLQTISAADAQSGNIFEHNWTDISTSLWAEDLTQGNGGDNGSIWCYQDDGSNILVQFSKITGMSMDTIICNQGNHRLLSRAKYEGSSSSSYYGGGGMGKYVAEEGNCNSFNDSGAVYVKADDAATQFKNLYENWRKSKSDNPYLPTYDELGNFNNTDGYFSYIADFGKKCKADIVSASGKQSGTDYYKIAQFSQSDNKLVVKNQYYHVNDNKTWDYALSDDNPVKSCNGLLERVAALQKVGNGVGKNNGYENILIGELNESCKTAITDNEKKIREALKDDADQLKALDDAKTSGEYTKKEGKRDDDTGQIYQCVVDINVDAYATPDLDSGSDSEAKVSCASSGAAGSLGWIVCPLLDWMGSASEDLYDGVVKDALQVEPQLFTGGNGGTRQGWENFRDIANVLFVILFLVVIFSQLTGVGIDNYGIKKILPKLIVAAIMINLSYFVCVVFVDLSNIFGNGLQAMFNNLASSLTVNNAVLSGMNTSGAGATVISVAILGALVAGIGAAVVLNPAILLSLLVAALGVIISVLFVFILLSVREAAIVVLVVLSPLAVVAYMLPNTKSLFDRWKKLFQALLMVYPICGLLIGGGNYVSKLLLSSGIAADSTFSAITAMVIGIVPVFAIPTVLKGSMAAMGTLGAKLSGMGKGASGWAQKKIQGSEGFKNAQQMGMDRRTRIKAGMDSNGNLTARGRRMANRANSRFGRLVGADRRLARYGARARKTIGEGEAAGATLAGALAVSGIADAEALDPSLGSSFADRTEGAYYGSQFMDAARRGDTSRMNSMIQAMKSSNMKSKDIAKLMRHALNSGALANMDAGERSAWMGSVAQQYGNDFLATDAELGHAMATRGASLGANGEIGGYGEYAAKNMGIDDIKPNDVSQLSGDSLAGLAEAGIITQGMASTVVASKPNVSEDKKIMLNALASGAASSATIAAGGGSAQFKADAEALMKDHTAGGATSTIAGADSATVDKWVANTPDDVNVVGGTVGVSGMDEINSQLGAIHSTAQNIEGAAELKHVGHITDKNGQKVPVYQRKDGTYVDREGMTFGNIDLK